MFSIFATVATNQVAAPVEEPKNEGVGRAPILAYCTIA
nr:a3.1 [Farysia itapuensis]